MAKYRFRMPQYRFQVHQGKFSSGCVEVALEDAEACWKEAAAICADLARDIIIELRTEPEWLLEATDETGQTVLRLKLVAEQIERNVELDELVFSEFDSKTWAAESKHISR